MEETNYHRHGANAKSNSDDHAIIDNSGKEEDPGDKIKTQDRLKSLANKIKEDRQNISVKGKTFFEKLKLFDKQELQYPNRLKEMALRPLIFLSFPVISYAGFSYGSNLVWFNVLNGTTSLILSKEPYGFGSSIVGVAYIAPFIGMAIG